MSEERVAAREHWASQGRAPFYEASQHWRRFIAERISMYTPKSVFEFGCNAGRNLVEVRKAAPEARLSGVDINEDAVRFGEETYGLRLHVAGEEYLAAMEDCGTDVAFTVSVLDHLPVVEPAFEDLARISRKALLLLEPYTGSVGRTDRRGPVVEASAENLTSVPFTYAWDYLELTRKLEGRWHWRWTPYPLSTENMGPHYWLIEGVRQGNP